MKTRREAKPARLHWGPLTLYMGAWKVAEIVPQWGFDAIPTGAPRAWRFRVGDDPESDSYASALNAMERAEGRVAVLLSTLGQNHCEFRRQDGSKRDVRIPDGTH